MPVIYKTMPNCEICIYIRVKFNNRQTDATQGLYTVINVKNLLEYWIVNEIAKFCFWYLLLCFHNWLLNSMNIKTHGIGMLCKFVKPVYSVL